MIILDRINLCICISMHSHLQMYILNTVLITILTCLFLISKAHNFHGFQGLLEHFIILLRGNRHVATRQKGVIVEAFQQQII